MRCHDFSTHDRDRFLSCGATLQWLLIIREGNKVYLKKQEVEL
jgi:hypothetical protein